MNYIRILIIEVNPTLNAGLKTHLEIEHDFTVKTSKEIKEAIEKYNKYHPHVILVNLYSPDIPQNGIQTVKKLEKEFPSSYIIVMDILPDNNKIIDYIRAGASGFILRDTSVKDIVQTIRNVSVGEKVLPEKVINKFFSLLSIDGIQVKSKSIQFTNREQEIINLIAQGKTNKEIARSLNIAFNTVKSRIHTLLDKLSLDSRTQLVQYANINKDEDN